MLNLNFISGRWLAGLALAAAALPSAAASPQEVFWESLRALCGQAFAGEIVANQPADPNDPFLGQPLRMHVRECSADQIKVPFQVGDDRSRTWIFSRVDGGLRLKHDHRHRDGSPDVSTMYGGDTASPGSAQRQEFPVDAYSIALFEREGRSVSTTNVWAVEIQPGQAFVYELARPGGRLFRVGFDLARPIDALPAPWGAETE